MFEMRLNFRLIIWFHFFFIVLSTNGWTTSNNKNDVRIRNGLLGSSSSSSISATITLGAETPLKYTNSEVVGAFGRMGSFWLCYQESEKVNSYAVLRGLSPGCISPIGSPIFVATPAASWESIYEHTPPNRRQDLIFVGNGIPLDSFSEATIIVPHFAILKVCQRDKTESPIRTNPISPNTFIYGKHAEYTARILQKYGVSTEIVESFQKIKQLAALKLVWASCMWLLCHSAETTEITVQQVHEKYQKTLNKLVDEIIPPLEDFIGDSIDRNEVDEYMKVYSLSIADAIPSLALAKAEFDDRNGVWLKLRTKKYPQAFHQELIQQVLGKEDLERYLNENDKKSPPAGLIDGQIETMVDMEEVNLIVSARKIEHSKKPALKQISIIGSGIIGSSAAFFLAKRRPDLNITVLDLLSDKDVGRTTPASWAWLNANGKEPKDYQILNQLGLHVWKSCKAISSLPSWTGSLVRFETLPRFVNEGGYPNEGPLSLSRILELEPLASWNLTGDQDEELADQGFTYFFPDEGSVDPLNAVRTIREAAENLGVTFLSKQNVSDVVRDGSTGLVSGIKVIDEDLESTLIPADLVIVAAGAGASAKGLGGLPLLHKPGLIAYASSNVRTSPKDRLRRILVDPLRSSHVLQRPDGCIVAGGGALEVGGSSGAQETSSKMLYAQSLLDSAKELAPSVLERATFTHSCQAVRPMPKDGLPSVGYLQQGLYSIVTHSGMTLGPILSALAAAEIAENVSCDILTPYRPNRLFNT